MKRVSHAKLRLKIKVTNYLKYNAGRKKSYRNVMISERFLDDEKIRSLGPIGRLLFLACILNAASSDTGEFFVSATLISHQVSVKPSLMLRHLQTLQELQLLSYAKVESLSERNGMEEKGTEGVVVQIPLIAPTPVEPKSLEPVLPSKPVQAAKVPQLFEPNDCAEVIKAMGKQTMDAWWELYNQDEDFLRRESIKAFEWYRNNPKKRPKTVRGWKQAMSAWFEKGWKWHAKSIPSNQQHKSQTTGYGEF